MNMYSCTSKAQVVAVEWLRRFAVSCITGWFHVVIDVLLEAVADLLFPSHLLSNSPIRIVVRSAEHRTTLILQSTCINPP